MTARDDGTPRQVRVLTTIRTWGKHCDAGLHDDDREDPAQCPLAGEVNIDTAQARCAAFGLNVELTYVKGPDGKWTESLARCPACLALDEPERTPEEAQAHGLGSQDG